jgi:S-adenosylmethionine:tRNA ribosyltransferase-isomerase
LNGELSMKTADFDYNLPQELIAQHPAPRREDARMMVLHRNSQTWEHRGIRDLPEYLHPGDLLVLNDTKVIPARVFGSKAETGGKVELLLLEELPDGEWDCLMRCSRRPKPGARITLGAGEASAVLLEDGEKGRARIRIESDRPFLEILEHIGRPPLPPYISRSSDEPPSPEDRQRYQTVYARQPGAVAAPTAGLHFSDELFHRLETQGIGRTYVTLHVGIGTFRPVSVDDVTDHRMDEERIVVTEETARAITETRTRGDRVIAVGSTSVRTLESAAEADGTIAPAEKRTDCFIYPPYEFKIVDAMLTNFHLPRSTLLMMISALAGREFVLEAYREAVRERYRFFSYGDGMLIL